MLYSLPISHDAGFDYFGKMVLLRFLSGKSVSSHLN